MNAQLSRLPDSDVIRAILNDEILDIRKGAVREERTLRDLWYNTVKIRLSQAGILNKETSGSTPEKPLYVPWAAKLSKYLAEMVREGKTSYKELNIIDGSRQRQVASAYEIPFVSVELVGAHYPWLVLFIEKDTTWPIVRDLASLYGTSVISGGGEPAFSCTADIVSQINDAGKEVCYGLPAITMLSLTDYDPSGYIISDAQAKQISEVAGNEVNHIRLGVEPFQLSPPDIETKTYELKDGEEKKGGWFERTNGVCGEKLGIELDALGSARIRQIFAEAIEEHINLDYRRRDIQEAFLGLQACSLLVPELKKKREAMVESVKKSGVWKAIQATPIDFLQAAVDGQSEISPEEINELYRDAVALVQAVMAGTGGAR